jgi:hypothetical protein
MIDIGKISVLPTPERRPVEALPNGSSPVVMIQLVLLAYAASVPPRKSARLMPTSRADTLTFSPASIR